MADYAVRPATLEDLPALTDMYNHYVVNTAITFDLQPFAATTRRGWLDDHAATGPHRLLVATDAEGECLGYASSSRWRPKPAYNTTVEASVYCRPDAVGRGCGTALYTALFAALDGEDVRTIVGWRQPAESRVAVVPREVRLSVAWRVPRGRPEVRPILGRRLVRAPTSVERVGRSARGVKTRGWPAGTPAAFSTGRPESDGCIASNLGSPSGPKSP
jgi:phosphinothricin acetyltransferase